MEKTMRVFLACSLGAFIGSMVALQLNHYFWWLGLLVGGFVGYISYEFRKVVAAAPVTWRAVIERKITIMYILDACASMVLVVGSPLILLLLLKVRVGFLPYMGLVLLSIGSIFSLFINLGELIANVPDYLKKKEVEKIKANNFMIFHTFFILIHSDIRLLCATDAAIGTAIGYFSGSALIGALAGGIFGIINYLVVSVKLLKLNHT